MRVRLGGKYFDIRFVPRLGDHGTDADGDCSIRDQVIRIRHGLSEDDFLETVIHEALHALMPYLEEDPVHNSAHDLMRLLKRFGYRKTLHGKCPEDGSTGS